MTDVQRVAVRIAVKLLSDRQRPITDDETARLVLMVQKVRRVVTNMIMDDVMHADIPVICSAVSKALVDEVTRSWHVTKPTFS